MTKQIMKVLAIASIAVFSSICFEHICDFLDEGTLRQLPRSWRRFAVRLRNVVGCPIAPIEWLRETEWVWEREGPVFFREDGRFESQKQACKIGLCRWYGNHAGIVVDYGSNGSKCHLFASKDRRALVGRGTHVDLSCQATIVRKLPRNPFLVLGISRLSSKVDVDKAYRHLRSLYEASKADENVEAILSLRDAYSKLSDLNYLHIQAFDGMDSRAKWIKALQRGLRFPREGFYSSNDMIVSVTYSTFANFVSGDKVAAVQFYSPWCPGCRAIVATYKEAGLLLSGSARLGAVNCESEMQLCQMQVGSEFFQNRADEPRVILFKDGKPHSNIQKPLDYSADMLVRFVLKWAFDNGVEVNPITADI